MDNVKELEKYIACEGLKFAGNVIAYHGAGATFMKGSPVYSTKKADVYNHNGGGAALVKNFIDAFGDAFDSAIHTTTTFITGADFTLAGVKDTLI